MNSQVNIKKYIKYEDSFKHLILKKGMEGTKTVKDICSEYGICPDSFYRWKKQAIANGDKIMTKKGNNKNWTNKEKLQAIKETASMNDEEKAEWCRKRGVYVHQLGIWEEDIISNADNNGDSTAKQRKYRHDLNKLKMEVETLKKDLNKKNRALAETAARLVLKKNLEAYFGEDEDQ